MRGPYSDGFLEEYVCELSNLCWAECGILNDSSITHESTYPQGSNHHDASLFINVSIYGDKEDRCQPAGDVERPRRKGRLEYSVNMCK